MKLFSLSRQQVIQSFKKDFVPQNDKEWQEAFIVFIASLSIYFLINTLRNFQIGPEWEDSKAKSRHIQHVNKLKKIAEKDSVLQKKAELVTTLKQVFKEFSEKNPSRGKEEKTLTDLQSDIDKLIQAIENYEKAIANFNDQFQLCKESSTTTPDFCSQHHLKLSQITSLKAVVPSLLRFSIYSKTLNWKEALQKFINLEKYRLAKEKEKGSLNFISLTEANAFASALKSIGYFEKEHFASLYEFLFDENPPKSNGKVFYKKACKKFKAILPNTYYLIGVLHYLFVTRIDNTDPNSKIKSYKCSQLWGLDQDDSGNIVEAFFEAESPSIKPLESETSYQKALDIVKAQWFSGY